MLAHLARRKGVTVVESVFGLALIAIMVTALIPALFASRENTRRFTCTQHLHQTGVEMQTFVQNFQTGHFPGLNIALNPNSDGTIGVAVTRRGWYAGGWNYFTPGAMVCPGDTDQGTVSIRNDDGTFTTRVASYGYSIRMLYNGIAWTDLAMGPPNEVAVFFDGSMSGSDSATGKNIEGNYLSTMDFALYALNFRHRNRFAGVAFADGHVKTFDYYDQSYYRVFGSGNRPAQYVINSASTTASTTAASTTASTTSNGGGGGSTNASNTDDGAVHNNNGHGNNIDGVDSSNPGRGRGGPGGGIDPSGTVDDERFGNRI